MSFRWRRFLPRYPAVLLVPTTLALWAALCFLPREHPGRPLLFTALEEPLYERGVPLAFFGVWRELEPNHFKYDAGFQLSPFLIDLALVLAAGWAFAMAVDRLVFPWVRSRKERKRANQPKPS